MKAHGECARPRRLFVVLVSLACAGCAARAPASEPVSELSTVPAGERSTGWQSLSPGAEPTTPAALRTQLEERRHDLLARCDEVRIALEERRRAM
ncbi:MAG: hypothetical protein WCJ30_07235, partial [Deltaproteobacteria bacterium]